MDWTETFGCGIALNHSFCCKPAKLCASVGCVTAAYMPQAPQARRQLMRDNNTAVPCAAGVRASSEGALNRRTSCIHCLEFHTNKRSHDSKSTHDPDAFAVAHIIETPGTLLPQLRPALCCGLRCFIPRCAVACGVVCCGLRCAVEALRSCSPLHRVVHVRATRAQCTVHQTAAG